MTSWDRPRHKPWQLWARLMLRLTIFVAVIGGLGGSLMLAIERSEQAPEHVEERDQRYLAYVLRPGQGPAFALGQLSPELRLLSWGHLHEGGDPARYDKERRYVYGLVLRVVDEAGEELHARTIWVRSRVSRRPAEGEGWAERAAYYPVGQGEGVPTDMRLSDVDLSAWDAPGRRLEVEVAGELPEDAPALEPGELWLKEAQVVVFRRFEREAGLREWQGRTLSERRRVELAERARLATWTAPTAAEMDRMLVGGWRRDTTLGEAEVRGLFTSEFRFEAFEELEVGEEVAEGEAMAFALEGPVTLYAARAGDAGGLLRAELARSAGATLRFERVEQPVTGAGDDLSELRPLETSGRALQVEVDDGESAAVQLFAPGGGRLAIWVDRPEAVAGAPQLARSADGRVRVLPDRRRSVVWEARAAGEAPLVYRLRAGEQSLGDALRVTLRHRRGQQGALRYRFVGASPEAERAESPASLAEGRVAFEAENSAYERLVDAEHLRQMAREAADPEALSGYEWLDAPTTHRFWIPPGAERLEVWVEGTEGARAWVSAAVLALAETGEVVWEPPYDRVPEVMRWRQAPSEGSAWVGIWPDNAEALTLAGRRALRESQARWEPHWGHEFSRELWAAASAEVQEGWEGVWGADAVEPPRRVQQRESAEARVLRPTNDLFGAVLLERVDPSELAGQRWEATWRAELRESGRVACRPAAGSDTLALEYRVGDGLVGRTVELRWQGETVRRQRLLSRTGRISARVGAGAGTLSLHLDAGGAAASGGERDAGVPGGRWWTDCEPTSPAAQPVWRQRRVHRVARGRDLVVEATSGVEGQRYLNVVAYLERPKATLRSVVDGGDPGGRAGQSLRQITSPEQRFELVASERSATLVGADGRALYGPVRVAVPLGSDWRPGTHRVRLRLDAGSGAWLRFFQLEE